MPTKEMTGQVVIVTGAGRGLGREYALEFGRRGAAVVVNDIARESDGRSRAEAVVEEIESEGGTAIADESNVMTSAGGNQLVGTAIGHFGRLDALVNNAGFLRPNFIEDVQDAEIADLLGIHIVAPYNTIRAAWPHFRDKKYGRIVLTSSGSSFGHDGNNVYSAAKASNIGMARSLSLEGAEHGITVNCIMPHAESLIAVENPLPGTDIPAAAMAESRRLLNSLASRRTTRSVMPMVVYLASAACVVSGEAFSALAGRYARTVFGLTAGWVADDANAVTAEDIARHLDEIMDVDGFLVTKSMHHEVAHAAERLQRLGPI